MTALLYAQFRHFYGLQPTAEAGVAYDVYLFDYRLHNPNTPNPGHLNGSVQAHAWWQEWRNGDRLLIRDINGLPSREEYEAQGLDHASIQHPTPPSPSTTAIFTTGSWPSGRYKPKKAEDVNKFYNIPFIDFIKNWKRIEKTDGLIGLEIEAEGMNLFDKPISWWATHQDGSLRPYKDHPPVEYVLRKPIPREDVPKALTYLTTKLKAAGSYIHESTRTSVHVHVNCQELTLKQIYQYVCLFLVFEEILVEFSGPDRPGNLFCLSAKQAEYFVTCLEDALQSENFNEVFSDNLRYTSCNTASLGKFGSLEFRSLRGTVDQGLIQMWVDILLMIRDKALEYKDPRSIVEDFQRLGPHEFCRKVFGSRMDIYAIFQDRQDLHKSLWDGLRRMRDVAYAIQWEEAQVVEKKRSPRKSRTR